MIAIQNLRDVDLTSEVGCTYFGLFIPFHLVWRVLFLVEMGAAVVGMLSIINTIALTPCVNRTGLWNRFNFANAVGIVLAGVAWYVLQPRPNDGL